MPSGPWSPQSSTDPSVSRDPRVPGTVVNPGVLGKCDEKCHREPQPSAGKKKLGTTQGHVLGPAVLPRPSLVRR